MDEVSDRIRVPAPDATPSEDEPTSEPDPEDVPTDPSADELDHLDEEGGDDVADAPDDLIE